MFGKKRVELAEVYILEDGTILVSERFAPHVKAFAATCKLAEPHGVISVPEYMSVMDAAHIARTARGTRDGN